MENKTRHVQAVNQTKLLLTKNVIFIIKTIKMKQTYLLIIALFIFSESFSQKTRGKRGVNYSKQAKQLSKQGWKSNNIETLDFQIKEYYEVRGMRNNEGRRVNITGIGIFTSDDRSIAYQTARDLAKSDIAGKIETQVRSVSQIDQRNDVTANSLRDAVIATTNLVKQKISGQDVYARYREVGKNPMGSPLYECEVSLYINFDDMAMMHKQLMRDEVNRNAVKEVRDEYEKFFKEGLYEDVRSNIDESEEGN